MSSLAVAFADAYVFMGMHNTADAVRIACKNFFVERIGRRLVMTLDQIGLCDDIVWCQPRDIQDRYYPFMDQLHTLLSAERVPYTRNDIQRAEEDPRIRGLDGPRALLVARVCNDNGLLYTTDATLLKRTDLPVRPVKHAEEIDFPEPLERAYQVSLGLRLQPRMPLLKGRMPCCAG